MTKKKPADRAGGGLEGIFKGLGDLVEKLSDLAEKGEQLSRTGEFQLGDEAKNLKGVFGFTVKTGLGGKEIKVVDGARAVADHLYGAAAAGAGGVAVPAQHAPGLSRGAGASGADERSSGRGDWRHGGGAVLWS